MENATEPTYTPLDSTDIELDIEDISYETPEEIPAKPIDPAYGNVLCIEDAPDYFDLDSFLYSSTKIRARGQKEKTYGLPSVSILKDEVWHVMSVSGAIFDNLPRAWEKRKALHMQVKSGLVSISFSDTVTYGNLQKPHFQRVIAQQAHYILQKMTESEQFAKKSTILSAYYGKYQ